ncbi:MAG: hypothetical protein V3V14_06710 [Saprospiraceae bacterium]
MNGLNKKAQLGLDTFKTDNGNIESVKSSLDSMVDDLLNEDYIKSSTNNKYRLLKFSLLAIGFIFIIGYFWNKSTTSTKSKNQNKVYYAQYFEPLQDAISNIERGGKQADNQPIIDSAMKYYNSKDYKKSASLLKDFDSADTKIYYAISLLADGNTSLAISEFDLMTNNIKFNKYSDIVDWYLTLAYLQNSEQNKAITLLDKIIKNKTYMHKEANKIRTSLN